MTWLFSLPSSIINSKGYYRSIYTSIERAYGEFEFVFPINAIEDYFDDRLNFDLWCQHNFCYYFLDRVSYDRWASRRRWVSNGIGGIDLLFIATNSEASATMAKLRWNEIDEKSYTY